MQSIIIMIRHHNSAFFKILLCNSFIRIISQLKLCVKLIIHRVMIMFDLYKRSAENIDRGGDKGEDEHQTKLYPISNQ